MGDNHGKPTTTEREKRGCEMEKVRRMDMQTAARRAGVPYPTVARWVQQGLITPPDYEGRPGGRVFFGEKELRELTLLVKLRGLLSLQALRKATAYLRKLGYNPLSTGYFAVLAGPPNKRRLIKIDDHGGAIELLGKHRGQMLLIPLWDEPRVKKP